MEVDTVDPPHEGGLRGKEGAGSSLPGFQAAAVQASLQESREALPVSTAAE